MTLNLNAEQRNAIRHSIMQGGLDHDFSELVDLAHDVNWDGSGEEALREFSRFVNQAKVVVIFEDEDGYDD